MALETVRAGTDEQIQEASQTVEQATRDALEARRTADEYAAKVAELEGELEHADQCVSEYAKEREQMQLQAELERLRQLEDVRQQFEKERERHRQERERDAATIEKLKRELYEEKKRLRVGVLPRNRDLLVGHQQPLPSLRSQVSLSVCMKVQVVALVRESS